jgi:hypothetical protein
MIRISGSQRWASSTEGTGVELRGGAVLGARAATACGALVLLAAPGCGGGEAASDEVEGPARTQQLTFEAGAAPADDRCGFEDLDSADAAAPRKTLNPPRPGTYSYETEGTVALPDEARARLPDRTETVITPATTEGEVSCHGTEQRFSPRATLSNVVIQRGEDVYLTAIGFASSNYVTTVEPRPAVLASAASGTRWDGTFDGPTSGSYEVEVIGRKTFDVGGDQVEAVGLDSRATYHGDTEGSQARKTWLSVDRPLILSESGEFALEVGGGEDRLEYETTLTSLEPETSGHG